MPDGFAVGQGAEGRLSPRNFKLGVSEIKGGSKSRGSGGRKSPSGVQGRSPGRGSGGRSPPEAEAF